MSDNVIEFRGQPAKQTASTFGEEKDEAPYYYRRRERPYRDGAMHTSSMRSYDLIVRSSEAKLVKDVSFGIDRAQRRLKKIQQQLKNVQERAAARPALLGTAENRLKAAIVAALLSAQK